MRLLPIFALLVLCALSFPASNVTGCTEIASAGDYVLLGNIAGANVSGSPLLSTNVCIKIDVSNVSLDCQGFNISGVPNSTGILLVATSGPSRLENVTVRDCVVQNYSDGYGIYSFNANTSRFINNTLIDEPQGLFLGTQGGNENNIGNLIANNTAMNGSNFCISSDEGINDTFSGNTVHGCGNGLFLTGAPALDNGNNVTGNTAYLSSNGLRFSQTANSTISGNTAYNNTNAGMLFESDSGNSVSGNAAHDNPVGYTFSNSGSDTISGNSAYNNPQIGFWLETGSGNTLSGNTASGSANAGIFVQDSNITLVQDTHLFNNTPDLLLSDSVGPIAVSFTGAVIDNPLGNFQHYSNISFNDTLALGESYQLAWSAVPIPPFGNMSFAGKAVNITALAGAPVIDSILWSWQGSELTPLLDNESAFDIFKYDGSWLKMNATLNQPAHTLSLSSLNPQSIFAILEPASSVCPGAISAAGSYALGSDISGAPNSASPLGGTACVVINASDVTFDCAGHTITNNGTGGTTYGVLLQAGATNVTVKDCAGISQYTYGLYVNQAPGNSILNSTAFADTIGFYSSASHYNVYESDGSFNNTDTGFYFTGSHFNNVTLSTAGNNTNSGFYFFTNGGIYSSNTAYNNSAGFQPAADGNFLYNNSAYNNTNGFLVPTTSWTNTLSGNNATGNSNDGFLLQSTEGDSLSGNNALNNSANGFELESVVSVFLTGNTAQSNGNYGFLIAGSSSSMTVSGNTAAGNGFEGFSIAQSSGIGMSSNNASGNFRGFTIYGSGSSGNVLSGNDATGNSGEGFLLALGAHDNNLSLNTAANNSLGFSFESNASSNIMTSNTATLNTAGFNLVPAAGPNTFSLNNASGNAKEGFFIQSPLSSLSGDTVSGNGAAGVYLLSANGSVLSGDHLFGNNPDLLLESSFSSPFSLDASGLLFDNPSGNLTNYTNVSINDSVELDSSYSLNWSAQPSAPPPLKFPFAGKSVNITRVFGSPVIDSITFGWLDSELGGYNESFFGLWEYNGTWALRNGTPDTAADTLSLSNVSSFSVFAILQNNTTFVPPSGGGPSGGSSNPALSISFNSTDDVVTVTSGGSPVGGATVKVNGSVIGTTDSNGQITVPGCGSGAAIDALMSGYTAASASVTLMACPAQCTTDANCTSTQACVAGACVEVSCPDGSVVNHACVVPQNQTNQTQCASPSCCTSSSQCADAQACVTPTGAPPSTASPGSCQQVSGQCGYAAGHAFVPYNYTCGTEPGCPSCPSGQSCVAHQCVQYGLNCPSGGVVGTQVTCNATQNGAACPNCDYQVTDPSGATTSGKSGPDGGISLPLNSAGQYKVSIMNAGAAVNSMQVLASTPGTQPPQQPAPPTASSGPDYTWAFLLVLLILIVGGAYLYMRGRK